MRSRWFIGVVAAGCGLLASWSGRAEACTCLPDGFARMDPEPEATDVARNHAVVVIGFFDPKTLELTAADGTAVPFELEAGPSSGCAGTMYGELIPKGDGFAANSTYRVRARPTYPESARHEFTFTTGDWSWAERLDYPPLEAKVSLLTNYPESGVSCATGSVMSCATLNYFKDVELIARKDGEILLRWVLQANDPNFLFKAVPDCIEFRRREPNGTRSTPLEICGDALNVSRFAESEVGDRDFFCRNGLVGAGSRALPRAPDVAGRDAGDLADGGEAGDAADGGAADLGDGRAAGHEAWGCSAAHGRRGPSAGAGLWFALASLLLVVRRRRSVAGNWY